MSTPGRFALLPHVQTQLAADATRDVAKPRLLLSYNMQVRAEGQPDGAPVTVSAELRGPGDVQALQRSQIIRIEPEPGLRGFEPNYFPFVEFVDADLPWRYSLEAGSVKRKKPWAVLIVLKPGEFELMPQGSRPLPVIKVFDSASSLPDLAQSWAFAHAQVNLPDTGNADPAAALTGNAAAGFSRLLCPRRLEERQSYWMFLVPSYRVGAEAGRGETPTAGVSDQPAWVAGDKDVLLPVYFESRFSTDSAEDFEELMRRLRGLSAAELAAVNSAQPVSAAEPGYYGDYSKPGATFDREAALVPPGRVDSAFATDEPLAERIGATLKEVIAGETNDPSGEDPLVALPPYGFRFRRETEATLPRAKDNQWFDRINLDLKFRHVAALGAQTVAENQEQFARLCWQQYEELRAANLELARLRTAEELVRRITTRRIAPLPADTALILTQPLQVVVPEVDGGPAIEKTLRRRGVPTAYASRTLRRQAAKRPFRASARPGSAATRDAFTTPAIPGDISRREAAPSSSARRGGEAFIPLRARAGIQETGLGGAFANRLAQLIAPQDFEGQVRPQSIAAPVAAFNSVKLVARIAAAIQQLPSLKAGIVVQGLAANETKTIEPVYRSPIVPVPLSECLEAFARDALIDNLSAIPLNTVSVFEENRAFVEAFLVGANHAINDELRWREFPTDMRGTIFARFWNRARHYTDPAGDDIKPIHQWAGRLGTHPGPADADAKSNLVFVIKGEIVRKLVRPIVVLNEAPAGATQWESGKGRDLTPVFFGKIGPDALFFGYDIAMADIARDRTYFVIYEPMGRLRMGLDVATQAIREERARFETRSLAFPVAAMARSYADVASRPARASALAHAQPASWDDLSWTHMQKTGAGYVDFSLNLSVTGSGQPDLWGSGKTSASVARSFWQKPLAGVLPLNRVL